MLNNTMTLAFVSVLFAGGALAATPPLQVNRTEAPAMQGSKISVAQAISTAESVTHGKVVNIVSRPGGDHEVYRVTIAANGRLRAGAVDGISGAFTANESLGPTSRAEQRAIDQAKVSLNRAVQVAQTRAEGKAGDAGLEAMRNGKFAYEIRVLKDGAFHDVWIDSQTGKTIRPAAV